MLFKVALVLLTSWLLGVLGVYNLGNLVHMLLLVGLMFVLIAVVKGRDAADGRGTEPPSGRK